MKNDIIRIIEAHENCARKPSNAFRKWDGKTPYFTHPLWCAMMIAAETNLDEKTREEGIQALLYHDILEDTTEKLPEHLSERVKRHVEDMTFYEGSKEEQREIWKKPAVIKLYKLYDKTHNLLDARWMDYEKKKTYPEYVQKLCEEVEQAYGELNITRIARAVIAKAKQKTK